MRRNTETYKKVLAMFVGILPATIATLPPAALAQANPPSATQPSVEQFPPKQPRPESAEPGEELGTVVLDLNKRIGTFRDWLEHQAEASKLPPDFAQRVARLAELRTQAGTSLGARAEYESQFSALLVEFDGALEAFVAGQEETFRRINEMESSLKDGKANMDAAARTSDAAYAQHAQRAKDLLASLVDGGRKAKVIVDSGATVPPEALSAAIEADNMKQTAEFLAEVSTAQAEQARSAADEIANQLRELKNLRASFQEDFTNAKNARLKASAIGDYRKQIADSSALLAQLEILKKAHRKGRSAIDNTAFRTLTDRGPAQAHSNSDSASPPPDNRGLELMLKYANQEDQKSVPNPTTNTDTSENISSGVNP